MKMKIKSRMKMKMKMRMKMKMKVKMKMKMKMKMKVYNETSKTLSALLCSALLALFNSFEFTSVHLCSVQF